MPPSDSVLREFLATMREDKRTFDRRLTDVLEQLSDLREIVVAQASTTRERLDKHADIERDRAQEIEDFLRKEIVQILPKVCQANEVGAAIRQVTFERKKELETQLSRDATGPQPLPPVPVAGHGSVRNDEPTGVFDRAHHTGEKRSIDEWIGGIARWGFQKSWKVLAGTAVGGAIVHFLHRFGVL